MRAGAVSRIVIVGLDGIRLIVEEEEVGMTILLIVMVQRLEEGVHAPAPPDGLPELREDEQIQDASGGDLVVVIARDFVPMQAGYGMREGYH